MLSTRDRIINIHPAYLPEFPGAHGIEDAWEADIPESGVTVHWVDSGVDTGQLLKQVRVPRLADDHLEQFEGTGSRHRISGLSNSFRRAGGGKDRVMIKKIISFVLVFVLSCSAI